MLAWIVNKARVRVDDFLLQVRAAVGHNLQALLSGLAVDDLPHRLGDIIVFVPSPESAHSRTLGKSTRQVPGGFS